MSETVNARVSADEGWGAREPDGEPSVVKVALVSGSDHLRYASYVGHQSYARKHGFAYHLELAPFDAHRGYWHKVKALAAHLDDYDWVVWFDDDAFITDIESDFVLREIHAATETGSWLVIAPSCPEELNGAWAAYNSGVFALRNSGEARALLETALAPPLADIERWWDAGRLGVFTRGDQDVIAWFVETHGYGEGIHWVDPLSWNARPWYFTESLTDHPVCHFPGHPDKTLAIARFARRWGVASNLVPGSEPDGSFVEGISRQVPSATRGSVAARRLALASRQLRRRVVRKLRWLRDTGRWS